MASRAASPHAQPEAPPRREVRGVVERITYQNPENGYTVARLAPERPEGEAGAAQMEGLLGQGEIGEDHRCWDHRHVAQSRGMEEAVEPPSNPPSPGPVAEEVQHPTR